MSATSVITVLVAGACYAVASVIRVELSNGRRVTGVAAFGPALIALGPGGYEVAPVWVVLAAALGTQGVAMGVRRVGWRQFAGTGGLFMVGSGLFILLTDAFAGSPFRESGPGPLLAATLVITVPYGAADFFMRKRRSHGRGSLGAELRWEVALYLVLGSTAGLVVLAFDPLGGVAFPLLLLALLVTWHEFHRFSEARHTYEQTVKAMGELAERAGYAPAGYHDQVSELAAKVGRALGLSGERVRALRLVGQVQRVGAVSLASPEELEAVPPSYVQESGRRILEETGYLAPHAHFLTPDGSAPAIEAEILKVSSRFIELDTRAGDAVASLRQELDVRDEVLDALEGCVQNTR